MWTASSARRTCRALRSASEYTATVAMPRVRQVAITRQAISPRLAIRILSKGACVAAAIGSRWVIGSVSARRRSGGSSYEEKNGLSASHLQLAQAGLLPHGAVLPASQLRKRPRLLAHLRQNLTASLHGRICRRNAQECACNARTYSHAKHAETRWLDRRIQRRRQPQAQHATRIGRIDDAVVP